MNIKTIGYFLTLFLSISLSGKAQLFNDSISAGNNFSKAAFRLWVPETKQSCRGVLVLVPGSNGDGRSECLDQEWQEFARVQHFALLACFFLDGENETPAAEYYANARKGSGQALLDAIDRLAVRSDHPELKTAPLIFWGMSAGGQFNYEFACWKPERTLAFVVNKGGVYYTALASEETRKVPGLFIVGEKDLVFRNEIIEGIFAINRRFDAIWTFAIQPGAEHIVGKSKELALKYFNSVIELRLPEPGTAQKGPIQLNALTNESGLLGDPRLMKIEEGKSWKVKNYPTSWLPDEKFANEWLNFINLK
jgi:dienelactone hydrolase